ncbi:MAG: hypothetical protein HY776_02850 [Actinobacteria bacterium]|nr:hypothetical protein [Actinomycetota bacterium]
MKVTSIRNFRDKATTYFKSNEPVLVTKYGKVTGLYLPLEHAESIPLEVKKELLEKFGEYLSRTLEARGVKEEEVIGDFEVFKKDRRRR